MSKYLVTGGAGFIGSNLVDELLKRGHKVRVFDNLSAGFKSNLNLKKIEFQKGDLRNLSQVRRAMKGVDGVFYWLHKTYQFTGMKPLPTFSCYDVLKNADVENDLKRFEQHLSLAFAA